VERCELERGGEEIRRGLSRRYPTATEQVRAISGTVASWLVQYARLIRHDSEHKQVPVPCTPLRKVRASWT